MTEFDLKSIKLYQICSISANQSLNFSSSKEYKTFCDII